MVNRTRTSELRAMAVERRPVVIYTGGCLPNPALSRSAVSLLRHLGERVVAVVDERIDGSTLDVVEGLDSFPSIPVVPDPSAIPHTDADLIVAMDLPGSKRLIDRHRQEILEAAASGRRVWNMLREPLAHANVRNLFAAERAHHINRGASVLQSTRILCVAADAAVATLETTLALQHQLVAAGHTADWLPTSPVGLVLRGYGRCVEPMPTDAAPGIIEELVMGLEARAGVVVVEGAGALLETADLSTVSALAAGARSEHHVLCHRALPDTDVAAVLLEAADRCSSIHRAVGIRSRLLAVSLDTSELDGADTHRADAAARSLGVPCVVTAGGRSHPQPIDAAPIAALFAALHTSVSA